MIQRPFIKEPQRGFEMGTKITLVGTRDSKLRKTEKYFAFEMNLGGSKNSPKGLPTPSQEIQFTVFVSLKAGNKIHIDNLRTDTKLLVEGELALDVPMEECPGEIGVIAFKVSEIPPKAEAKNTPNYDTKSIESAVEQADKALSEVATSIKPSSSEEKPDAKNEQAPKPQKNGTLMVALADIHVPEEFLQTTPNPAKTELVRRRILKNGELDEPITVRVEDGKYWMTDGYRRYIIASEEGFQEVPIKIQ